MKHQLNDYRFSGKLLTSVSVGVSYSECSGNPTEISPQGNYFTSDFIRWSRPVVKRVVWLGKNLKGRIHIRWPKQSRQDILRLKSSRVEIMKIDSKDSAKEDVTELRY